jgi:uncharacterized protein (DUF1501 family)
MDDAFLPRRRFLTLGAVGAGAIFVAPQMLLARAETDRRFVFIIQRGAADGLNIVVPYADPSYAKLRGGLAIDAGTATKLDGSFALHPALTQIGQLYAARQALFVHAVASPYRDRSHFDGQNVLETGGAQPYQLKDGWLNRLVSLLPGGKDQAVAITATVPAALRGPAKVISYAPTALPQASDDLIERVGALYAADPQLHSLWSAALETRSLTDDEATAANQNPAMLGRLAANFLAKPNGPRIAMLETGGWDTHTAQEHRLDTQLKGLDVLVAAIRDGMGSAWQSTTILVATEFGRTAAANGTGGTDHGTGSAAMLFGGAIKGGRVLTDWPGLAAPQLHQGRDLKPTMALDALIAGAAAHAMGLDPELAARTLFPGTALKPTLGLEA